MSLFSKVVPRVTIPSYSRIAEAASVRNVPSVIRAMNELPDLPATRRVVGFRNEGMFFKAEVLFQQLAQADPA